MGPSLSPGGLTRGQPHPLLASLALPGRTLPTQTPPQLSLKHFLPLRVNGSTGPLHLFPNFSTMDPVQKAVINHTFGVAPPKKKSIISCNICHLRFNSMNQAEAHYKGHKHARKLKALVGQRGPQRSRQRAGPTPLAPGRDRQKERGRAEGVAVLRDTQRTDETSMKPFYIYKSISLYVFMHKQMLDGQSGGGTQLQRRVKVTSSARPASRPKSWAGFKTRAGPVPTGQPFHCELCQLSVNSESQLKQHMSSRRHKERVSGKPSKPKFTPYAKVQPSTLLATKLALQKHLSKALPPGFLHNPFNPAALCTLASGPLALRGPHGPTAFFQGPLISPTLFRPAPGPLRATHAPIIFSPY
uniref:C2H2-type domain-containing protein n=1 Tax=Gadus morhua TaxID=8049 RepID=A0A8C4YYZ3_GADMO